MKRKQGPKEFIQELRGLVSELRKMKPSETHVISVDANYGHYELTIRPNEKPRSRHRPIEISGEIHHLFLSNGHMMPNPPRQQIMENLKETVIARGLMVHLVDPIGDGEHLARDGNGKGLEAREFINLAGSEGEKQIWNARHSEELMMETYHIIQSDIIKALKQHKRRSLEYVS